MEFRKSRFFLLVAFLGFAGQACTSGDNDGGSDLASRRGNQCTTFGSTDMTVIDERTATGQWLQYSEGRGPVGREAHTLLKHVARDDDGLRSRFAEEPVSASSTFPDEASAEAFVGRVILENHDRIVQWFTQTGERQIALVGRCEVACGSTMRRGETESVPTDVGNVFLLRECTDSGVDIYVNSAFPGPLY